MSTPGATPSNPANLRIAIVGAGIGGLAAALFLRQLGLDVTVHEQAAELAEVGAGIVVAPNMVRLLHKLGLGDALTAFAVRLEAAWEFRSWRDGRVLFVQPMGDECERRYGAHCYVAHRADLVGMLRRSLPRELLHLDHRCVAIRPSDHDVELAFVDRAGGTSVVVTDGVIGADGIHSAVRSMIGPEVMPRFSGLCAFRCLVPAEQAPEMARRPVQTLWLGPGRHFVHYPISGGRLINVVAFAPAGAWRTESWTADGEITDLRAEFAGWDATAIRSRTGRRAAPRCSAMPRMRCCRSSRRARRRRWRTPRSSRAALAAPIGRRSRRPCSATNAFAGRGPRRCSS